MAETSEKDLARTKVVSAAGDRVGRISRVLVHRSEEEEGDAKERRWVLVRLGVLGLHTAIVPLEGSEEEDGHLRVPYELDWIRQTPDMDVEGDELNDEQADRLHGHYGLERILAATIDPDEIPDLPRETRDATPPGLEDEEDNASEPDVREDDAGPQDDAGSDDGPSADEGPEERAEADTGADAASNAGDDEDDEPAESDGHDEDDEPAASDDHDDGPAEREDASEGEQGS